MRERHFAHRHFFVCAADNGIPQPQRTADNEYNAALAARQQFIQMARQAGRIVHLARNRQRNHIVRRFQAAEHHFALFVANLPLNGFGGVRGFRQIRQFNLLELAVARQPLQVFIRHLPIGLLLHAPHCHHADAHFCFPPGMIFFVPLTTSLNRKLPTPMPSAIIRMPAIVRMPVCAPRAYC